MKNPGILILSTATLMFSCNEPKDTRLNILYIMSDDHAVNAIGAYGGRLAELNPTPVLDQLAREGMLFTRVFCSNSICTPSRATILTGQYSQTNRVLDLDGELDAANQYLPREMGKLGYETAVIGKWHLKREPDAFDHYCVLPLQGDYFDPEFRVRGENAWTKNTFQRIGHSTDIITDLTIEWLKNRDTSKPFFLMHQYKAPHDMFEFAPRYTEYLEDVIIPEPASMYYNKNNGSVATRGTDNTLIHDIGSSVSRRNPVRNMGQHMNIDNTLDDLEYTSQAYQEYLKRYLRCVKGIDDNLQRLFDFLKDEGLWDNTLIIYTSDQGFILGEHDYIDKRWMYEESMQMPFMVRFPKMVEPGTISDLLINNADFAPTLIELAGGEVPNYMQGRSFANVLKGQAPPDNWRKATYYRYWMHMAHRHAVPAHFGIRTDRYKLIFFYGRYYSNNFTPGPAHRYEFQTPAAWEFYDLENDRYEMDNRYGDHRYSDIIRELKIELLAIREELNETDADYPEIQRIIDAHWDD
jgi:N-acetylglucosamine-6-sulfatase